MKREIDIDQLVTAMKAVDEAGRLFEEAHAVYEARGLKRNSDDFKVAGGSVQTLQGAEEMALGTRKFLTELALIAGYAAAGLEDRVSGRSATARAGFTGLSGGGARMARPLLDPTLRDWGSCWPSTSSSPPSGRRSRRSCRPRRRPTRTPPCSASRPRRTAPPPSAVRPEPPGAGPGRRSEAGGMHHAPVVVHRIFPSGGRQVTLRTPSGEESLGLARSDEDVIEFLRRAGMPDPTTWSSAASSWWSGRGRPPRVRGGPADRRPP
ncbi:hypothetical protein WKI68_41470 [Streptomyces sp. MS1.HAVA.3]|uniref:Uncharacterized protein n=1 Tax=Streptomyces caledonius TaxID=3134107 RepID=A0ABU8UDJ3_9ACTN